MMIPDAQIELMKQRNICALVKLKPDGLECSSPLYKRLLPDFRSDFQHLFDGSSSFLQQNTLKSEKKKRPMHKEVNELTLSLRKQFTSCSLPEHHIFRHILDFWNCNLN